MIEVNKKKVGINTQLSNKIVLESLKKKKIKSLIAFANIETEVKFSDKTRFDFLISNDQKKCFLEVKNVTLSRKEKIAEFPDAITSRGTKHLKELIIAKNNYTTRFFGRLFKGPKFFSSISPNKTWSGFLSGVILSAFFSLCLASLLKGPWHQFGWIWEQFWYNCRQMLQTFLQMLQNCEIATSLKPNTCFQGGQASIFAYFFGTFLHVLLPCCPDSIFCGFL